jgi:hypothetical protein
VYCLHLVEVKLDGSFKDLLFVIKMSDPNPEKSAALIRILLSMNIVQIAANSACLAMPK